jgi:hypothetical protein
MKNDHRKGLHRLCHALGGDCLLVE